MNISCIFFFLLFSIVKTLHDYNFFIQVGKWNGKPIYKTHDKDVFNEPTLNEFYCHAPYWDFYKKAYEEQIQV